MNTRSLIIAGALLFALGVAAGTLLAPRQSAALASNAASATGSNASGAGDSGRSDSASADSDLSGDLGARLQAALFGASRRQRDHALATLGDGLTVAQLQAAVENVQKLKGKNKSAVLAELLGQWAVTDPKGATQYAMALTRKADRDAALSAIAAGWAEADPKAAEAWADSLQDAGARDAAIAGLIGTIASSDPQYALTLAQSLPAGQAASCESAIIGAWLENDPQGASAAILKLPLDGQEKNEEIGNVASSWERNDPAAANQWLDSLPTGTTKDDALQGAAASASPSAAETLLAGIGNDQARMAAETQVATDWMKSNPAAATAWIQSSNLPQPTKDYLLGEH